MVIIAFLSEKLRQIAKKADKTVMILLLLEFL